MEKIEKKGEIYKMRRTIKLIEKQNITNGDEIYNKMKKEFLNKQHKKELEYLEKRDKEKLYGTVPPSTEMAEFTCPARLSKGDAPRRM